MTECLEGYETFRAPEKRRCLMPRRVGSTWYGAVRA